MKKSILSALMLVIISSVSVFSQDNTKVLFKSVPKIKKISFNLAPEYQYGQILNQFTSLRGIAGAVVFNNRLSVGFSTQTISSQSFSPASLLTTSSLSSRFSGLKLEYTLFPNKLVHFTFPLALGTASARLGNNFGRRGGFNQNSYYVIQPGAQAEINLFKFMKVYTGFNYRFSIANAINDLTLPASTLKGLSFNFGTKINLFDKLLKKN